MFTSQVLLYLHKLGDKDHDDDNRMMNEGKEKPDLESPCFQAVSSRWSSSFARAFLKM